MRDGIIKTKPPREHRRVRVIRALERSLSRATEPALRARLIAAINDIIARRRA
jgi:hypothetical protein